MSTLCQRLDLNLLRRSGRPSTQAELHSLLRLQYLLSHYLTLVYIQVRVHLHFVFSNIFKVAVVMCNISNE